MSAIGNRMMFRQLIRNGHSMDDVEKLATLGYINMAVYSRFVRIFAWATATEHAMTRNVPLARWMARREKLRRIIREL